MAGETTTPTATRRPVRVEKHHLPGFLAVLAILDLIILGLSAYCLDKIFDGTLRGQNGATYSLVIVTLIASLLTLAAIISGFFHFRHYNSGSVSSASTTALIAWAVTLLAFGLACKQADIGYTSSRTKALEAFVIIFAFVSTLYTLLLHIGLSNSKYGVGY